MGRSRGTILGIATAALTLLAVDLPPLSAQGGNSPFVPPDSVEMRRDVVYAQPNNEPQRLDVFVPRTGTGPFPVVVFVVCGGWRSAYKADSWPLAGYLAARGFVSVTTQCRPAPGSRYPAQVNDLLQAVRWVREHASEYKADASRVAVAGGSSGAHLASVIGTNRWNGSDWSGAGRDSRVQAVVAMSPVLSLVPCRRDSVVGALGIAGTANAAAFLGVACEQDPTLWRDASPLFQVGSQSAPFLLLAGTADGLYSQSVDMERRLKELGVRVELFTADGAGHGFTIQQAWYERTSAKIAEFLTSVLKS